MGAEGSGEPEDISERVARGFEALVAEEPPLSVTGQDRPAEAAPAAAPARPADASDVESLETRVRRTMDRITELVEAQLPETVDGLRADLETLRLELQTSLTYASEQLADERRQLRAEIAATVGAANRWFVRTRDQLYARLDHIAEAATAASEQAERAASAALSPQAPLELEPGPPPEREAPSDAHDDADFEWDVGEEGPTAERREAPLRSLDASLVRPLREDIQDLHGEVTAMGQVLALLREDLEALRRRIPARARPVHLDPADIELIVTAVMMANPPAPAEPAPRAPRTAPAKATTKATRAPKAARATKAAKAATKTTKATKATKRPTTGRSTGS